MPLLIDHSNRIARARRMVEAAQAARAAMTASTTFACTACGKVNFKYDPPLSRITLPCRRCGEWIDTGKRTD